MKHSLQLFVLCGLTLASNAEQEVYVSSATDFNLMLGTESSPALASVVNPENIWGVTYSNQDNLIYFSNPTSGEISSYNTATRTNSVVISEPTAVFHGVDAANGSLYALRSGSDDLVRYDLPSTTVNVVVASGLMRPNDVVVDTVRGRIFVTDSGLDEVLEYTISGTLIQTWDLDGAWGIALHPTSGDIYVSRFEAGDLWRNSVGSTSFSRVASGLTGPRGVEIDRDGKVYVVDTGLNLLVEVESISGVITPTAYTQTLNGHAMVVYDGLDKDGDYLADTWELSFNGSLADVSASTSADGDANTGMLEYAFMGDPSQNEGSLVKNYTQNGSVGFSVSMSEVDDANISTSYMVSNDLLNWVTVTPTSTVPNAGNGYAELQFDLLENSYFIPSVGKLFFKANAEPNR